MTLFPQLMSRRPRRSCCASSSHRKRKPGANPNTSWNAATPHEKILEFANGRETDLIVLGVRPEKGVPGAATHLPIATAHKIVSHATCPVLTVRH